MKLNKIELEQHNYLNDITLSDFKEKLGVKELEFTIEGTTPTTYKHWNYKKAIQIIIHEAILQEIKANPNIRISIEQTFISTSKGWYTKFEVSNFKELSIESNDNDFVRNYENIDSWMDDNPTDAYWNID